jgi:hypothetical protein
MKTKSFIYLVLLISLQGILFSCGEYINNQVPDKEQESALRNGDRIKDTLQTANPSANKVVDSFNLYLNRFVLKKLPVPFGDKEMNESRNVDAELDTFFVSKFIEKDSAVNEDINIYSLKKYYPVFKVKMDVLWIVVVNYMGGSGGIDNEYHLLVYDSSGNNKSNIIVGYEKGDCGFMDNQTFKMNAKGVISCKRKVYTGNCETDEMKLSNTSTLAYQIGKEGNVNKIK